jgi:outer membrane protein
MRVLIKSASFAFVASLLVIGAASGQTAAPKLAYINSSRIAAEAPGVVSAEAQLNKEFSSFQTQLQSLQDSLQTLQESVDREAPRLDSATRAARVKSANDRAASYQQRAAALNQQMQTRQQEVMRPVMEQVRNIIETIRTEGNYAFIFDVTSQAQAIVSADKRLDLTDQVIARLKAGASATGAVQQQPAGVTRK